MLLCFKITVSKHAWALSNLHFVVGSDSVLKTAVSDPKINGKRIFVFIIGGMTRSEVCPISAGLLESMLKIISILAGAWVFFLTQVMVWPNPQLRVAHKLTPQLKREVVLGSTNLDDPKKFIRVCFCPYVMWHFNLYCNAGLIFF